MKVLDSSYILHSDLDFSNDNYFTTNSVLEEIKSEEARLMIDSAIKRGEIRVIDPSFESVEKVKKIAKKTGDLEILSRADLDLLALALEKNFTLLTDDYSIQNIAAILKVKWQGLQQEGIKKKLKWVKVCPGCQKKYEQGEVCEVCGTKLRRKVSHTLK